MKICYNCFHTANDSFRFCEKCGSPLDYQNSAACPDALECGTTLYGRYLIGNVLQQDDSSITYAAQDSRTKGRVAVREYFPRAYSSRTSIVHNQIGCIILVEIRLNAGGLAGFVFSGKVFRIL